MSGDPFAPRVHTTGHPDPSQRDLVMVVSPMDAWVILGALVIWLKTSPEDDPPGPLTKASAEALIAALEPHVAPPGSINASLLRALREDR